MESVSRTAGFQLARTERYLPVYRGAARLDRQRAVCPRPHRLPRSTLTVGLGELSWLLPPQCGESLLRRWACRFPPVAGCANDAAVCGQRLLLERFEQLIPQQSRCFLGDQSRNHHARASSKLISVSFPPACSSSSLWASRLRSYRKAIPLPNVAADSSSILTA